MSSVALRAEGLGKRYRIGAARGEREEHVVQALGGSLRGVAQRLRRGARRPEASANEVWALRDVSFAVPRGEVLGIVGRNGAGKSTLLKVLSRITPPTEGGIDAYGRVGSLLEVGTGFHPDLTGRENIFLNGSILGMTRAEISRKLDQIVAFSGVERFLDTPVKRYSSGMYVRLAFAVAAHLEPEILVVDEVLAVGDTAFQQKCLGRMSEVAREGRTVLFVSHNLAAVTGLCSRAMLLEGGRLVDDGPAEAIVASYVRRLEGLQARAIAERTDRQGNGRLRITGVVLEDEQGEAVEHVRTGDDVAIRISYQSADGQPLANVQFSLHVFTSLNQPIFNLWNELAGTPFPQLPACGSVRCRVPRLPLMPGRYSFNAYCEVGMEVADWVQSAGTLEVVEGDYFGTGRMREADHRDLVAVPQRWEVVSESGAAD